MARLPRLALDGHCHLVAQAGTHAQRIFADDADRSAFVSLLADAARAQRVAVHGYALLPHAFYLLLTPERGDHLPRLMQALGRGYVRRFNARHARQGTLWQGRYRSTVVQADRYALTCLLALDEWAVQGSPEPGAADGSPPHPLAGPQPTALPVPFSSGAHYRGQRSLPWLTPPAAWWALGNTPFAREAAYAAHAAQGLDEPTSQALDRARRGGWVLGDEGFHGQLAPQSPRRVSPGRAGRPRRAPADTGL